MRAETESLVLSDLVKSDINTLIAYFNEAQSRESVLWQQRISWLNRIYLRLEAMHAKNIVYSERNMLCFIVIVKESGKIIGSCNLSCGTSSNRGKIGWHYGYEHRGQGYATEAAKELLRIGFEERNLDSIYADCFEANLPTLRILEKLEMNTVVASFAKSWVRRLCYMQLRPIVRYKIEDTNM